MNIYMTVSDACGFYEGLDDANPGVETIRNQLIEYFFGNVEDFSERCQIINALYNQGELIELFENHDYTPAAFPILISSRTFQLLFSIVLDTEDEVLLNYVLRTTMPTPMEALEIIIANQIRLLADGPDVNLVSYDVKKLYLCTIAASYVMNHRDVNAVRVPDEKNIAIGYDTSKHVET